MSRTRIEEVNTRFQGEISKREFRARFQGEISQWDFREGDLKGSHTDTETVLNCSLGTLGLDLGEGYVDVVWSQVLSKNSSVFRPLVDVHWSSLVTLAGEFLEVLVHSCVRTDDGVLRVLQQKLTFGFACLLAPKFRGHFSLQKYIRSNYYLPEYYHTLK